jgi:hypothetical protein
VPVIGDRLGGPDESFALNLTNPTGAGFVDDVATASRRC